MRCGFEHSLVVGGMDAARCGHGVKSLVNVLATEEGVSELFRAGVELGGHVHLRRLLNSILHVASLVERVSNSESRFGVLDVFLAGGEATRLSFVLLDHALLGFDLLINLRVKLALLSHFLQDFMFVSPL